MLLKTLAFGFCMIPAVAAAEWTYDPAPMPAGRAVGEGLHGINMAVECGNGGYPAFFVEGYSAGAAEDLFVIEFNAWGEQVIAASCQGNSCLLEFDSLDHMAGFVTGLRDGWVLRIGLYRRGALTEVPLTYTAYTLDQIAARGCDGL